MLALCHFGRIWGPSWGPPGGLGGRLGAAWRPTWGPLGRSLGASGAVRSHHSRKTRSCQKCTFSYRKTVIWGIWDASGGGLGEPS